MITQALLSKKKGRSTLFKSNNFVHGGYNYRVNYDAGKSDSSLNSEILEKFINEICAMRKCYKRVYAFRFDLHVPSDMPVAQSNILLSQLFEKLRDKFKAKNWDNQPIKKFVYGWVCEIETAKQAHYHLWIAFPGNQVKNSGHVGYGMFKVINDLWLELTGNLGRSHLPDNPGYMITSKDDAKLDDFIYRISYLAKERGKYSYSNNTKRFDGSRLHGRLKRESASIATA